MIVVFTGGTGGAKLVQGLQQRVAADKLTVIVNTGDDLEWWGLHVSPDIDSVLYALAGLLSTDRGWGVEGDSFRCLERMKQLGEPSWFSLGDLDLATHLTRTAMLRAGRTLSEATAELARKFGICTRVLPMSDDRVSTMLDTAKGTLTFQEYFVRERYQVEARAVRFECAEKARPAPGVIESVERAEAIFLAPSNPVTSIGPILAVPGIREALRQATAPIIAVSPIVGGTAVSGPAAKLMEMMGWPSSVAGIAQAYEDFLDALVVDHADEREAKELRRRGLHVHCTQTLMRSPEDKLQLAQSVLNITRTIGKTCVAASP
ncbi:MAG TPA: 2-phospho-L-lactate transferase [Bryocella sp.]|nr:2-phospho-L-lactate transferase [Bryocella sp.]